MLSLRSLAFILASALRRARALSCAALHRFPDRISGRKLRKMATKMPTKMAVACMSVPTNSLHILGSDGTSRRCPVQKYNQRRFRGHYQGFSLGPTIAKKGDIFVRIYRPSE